MLVLEELTGRICGAAIEVHKHIGPGLLESAYKECLCHEFNLRGLTFKRQVLVLRASVPPWLSKND
ncbi:MAG: GxxExxY protein [Pirellulaceae bacterium]